MAEKPIVIQLQSDCLDKNIPVSDLLRKAMLIARKLGAKDIISWLSSEMDGYSSGEIPDYRILQGQIMYHNPYNGHHWPIMFKDERQSEIYSQKANGGPIGELEALVISSSADSVLAMEVPHKMAMKLVTMFNLPSRPFFQIQRTALIAILDAVRNRILDWALKMEESGVLGDDLSFSKEEKSAATSIVFNIGHMSNSQIQGAASNSSQEFSTSNINLSEIKVLAEKIKAVSKTLDLDELNQNQIGSDIETIETQVKAPKPKVGIIKESFLSLQRIFENAIGGAAGAGIAAEIAKVLSQM